MKRENVFGYTDENNICLTHIRKHSILIPTELFASLPLEISACNPNPCENDGTCTEDGEDETFNCTCTSAFEGKTCQSGMGLYDTSRSSNISFQRSTAK